MNFKLIIETEDLASLNDILTKIGDGQKPMGPTPAAPILDTFLPGPREISFGEDPYRVCECGCGRRFLPKRADSRFYSRKCAQQVYQRNFLNKHKKKHLTRS